MDTVFLIKLALSFLIGGVWVIFTTVLADRFGSKLGGLITGLPSTVLFSLFFLAWTQNSQFVVQSTTIFPIIVGIENLYLLTYIYLSKRTVWFALTSALAVWFVLALGLYFLHFNNYVLSLAGYLLSLFISYFITENVWKIESITGKKISYKRGNILLRGFLSGSIVAFSVLIGKIGGPILGGVFAGFPAVFTSTLLITYLAQGQKFSVAVAKNCLLSASSLVIYSVAVRYTYLPLGIILGTLFSIFISLLSTYLVYRLIVVKQR